MTATRVGDVVLQRDGPVLRATIDRPEARNAISGGVVDGLEAAVERATAEAVTVLVLRGAGGTFCAGADLGVVLAGLDDFDSFRRYIVRLADVLDAVEAAPFVSVAVVEGFALAGGCEIVLACDVAVAADDARIGDRHLELGLLPGAGGSVRLTKALSPARSRWLLLSGEMLSGRQAAEWGLVSRAVPPADLDATAEAMVARLASRSADALTGAKRMAAAVRDAPVAEGMERERKLFFEHMTTSPAVRDALTRFVHKEEKA